ncbi:MAG: helix-turn-helix transcriptional regulator [Deinococcales bacterium]
MAHKTTLLVLDSLLKAEDGIHGYSLCKQLEIKSGTLYPILLRLAEKGYLEQFWVFEGSGPPKRVHKLSESGRQYAFSDW